jgi:alkanesulfonate monooxygenase
MTPTLRFHWRLLDGGEAARGASVATRHAEFRGSPDLDAQVRFCRDAEEAGIDSLLVDVGFAKPDPMLLAVALARRTERVTFMVACRPGLMSPTLFVQQVNSFSALAGGRISLNVVAGHSAVEMGYYGDALGHDERYQRMEEFLSVCRSFWESEGPVEFSGRHYSIRGGRLQTPFTSPTAKAPEVFVGGNSGPGRAVAAQWADCWVRFPLAPDRLAGEIRPVLDAGKQVGLRLGVVARPTRAEAVSAARDLVDHAGAAGRDLRAFVRQSDSQSIRSIDALSRDEWLSPCLWTGAVPTLGVTSVCLVGSYDEVADQLVALRELGVSQYILTGWPKWDEMVRFGRDVIPRVRDRERGRAVAGADTAGING